MATGVNTLVGDTRAAVERFSLGVLLEELSEGEMTGLLTGLRALHAARSRMTLDADGVTAAGGDR